MWDVLVQPLQDCRSSEPAFDPVSLGDPLAVQTDWSPMSQGGMNLCTRRLESESAQRLTFRPEWMALVSYAVFLAIGLFVVRIAATGLGVAGTSIMTVLPVTLSVVFMAVWAVFLWRGTTPIVFDLDRGLFWKGRKEPAAAPERGDANGVCDLSQVHALQIVSEQRPGEKAAYRSYELNLVLRNGDRVNVVDHARYRALVADAESLASLLGRPIWNAVRR